MKASFFAILLALCLIGQVAFSQTTKYKRPYRVWVTSLDTNAKLKGYLIQTKDSSIVVSKTPPSKAIAEAPQEIATSTIKKLTFRKKGRVVVSILQAVLTEVALGSALAIATGDPFIGAAAILYMPAVAVVGGAIGSIKTKVPINGDQQQYQQSREKLIKFTSPANPHVIQPQEASTSRL